MSFAEEMSHIELELVQIEEQKNDDNKQTDKFIIIKSILDRCAKIEELLNRRQGKQGSAAIRSA